MRILPKCMDFYYAKQGDIADRVLYEKDLNGCWSHKHIAAWITNIVKKQKYALNTIKAAF